MFGYYHDLKKNELDKAKKELKSLDPNSSAFKYTKERIDYLLSDLFTLENEKRVYSTTE